MSSRQISGGSLGRHFLNRVSQLGFIIAAGFLVVTTPVSAESSTGLLMAMLRGPLSNTPSVIFTTRVPGKDGHWYANFGYQSGDANRPMYTENGSRLCQLDLATGKVRDLLADPTGSVRDPQVHYDGRKVLFSYRKGGTPNFHLYEMNLDGTGLRQITDGPYDDIEPVYLPDGDLVFCSSRCHRWVQCWFTQVAILYRCDAQGGHVRPLSANCEQDNTPWLLPDGRILYMRWEYVDRSRVKYHHLWTMNPDGTRQMVYYGNQHPGIVMLDAKPIPGTDKVLSVFSPGHGRKEHGGRLTVVDPSNGPDDQSFARPLVLGEPFDARLSECRDPYPVATDCVFFASERSLYVTDGRGHTEEICALPKTGDAQAWLQEPHPVCRRNREPVIPAKTMLAEKTGYVVLQDVTHGRNMRGVKPGEIKKLLVMETLPKPVNHSGTMEPISYGGTFTLPRILGTVPVEPDGSAYIELPALRSLFFVALDEHDLSVKRMQSFLTVMPGETFSCTGCHENRTDTARARPARLLAALNRPPSRIEPIPDVPDVFDFPRDIQPILDRHCVTCHNDEQRSGKLILTGDHGSIFSHAYAGLMSRGLISHGQDAGGNKPPRGIGSSASRLMQRLMEENVCARLSPLELKKVRLWIESGAPYAGTYAALGSGISPIKLNSAITNSCAICHGRNPIGDGELAFNLTHPEKSLALMAPLAKSAGGYGLCRTKERGDAVFADARDPDYLKMLAAIRQAQARLEENKRFDMAGFKPQFPYVREMKRYGILPRDFNLEKDSVDVYATDRAYWQSLWWRPTSEIAVQGQNSPILKGKDSLMR